MYPIFLSDPNFWQIQAPLARNICTIVHKVNDIYALAILFVLMMSIGKILSSLLVNARVEERWVNQSFCV